MSYGIRRQKGLHRHTKTNPLPSIEISYETFVVPVIKNLKVIEVQEDPQVNELAEQIVNAKHYEYITDKRSLSKRIVNGLYGELALEKYLGCKIIDWAVGDSSNFNHGDITDLDVGIKTVEYGKFPIIHLNPVRPEIILLKHELRFLLCGLYTEDIMMKFQTRDFIIDPNIRKTKTAFYGIPFYKSFSNLEELRSLCGLLC